MAIHRFAEHYLGRFQLQPGRLGSVITSPAADPAAAVDGTVLHEHSGFFSRRLSGLGGRDGAAQWARANLLRERCSYNHTTHRLVTPEMFEERGHWFAKDAAGQPMRPPFAVPHGYNDHPDLTQQEVRDWHVDQVMRQLAAATPLQAPHLPPPYTPARDIQRSPGMLSISLGLGDSFIFGHFADDHPLAPAGWFRRWPDWSPLVFDYSNEVAARVRQQFQALPWPGQRPSLYFGVLAYLLWEQVPPFAVEPDIVPILTFDRSQWYDPEARQDDLDTVRRWAAMGTDFVGTWDYFFGFGFFIPRSMSGIISDAIPALHAAGVDAYFSQIAATWPYDGHTNWLLARLLWDPTADPDALLDFYFNAFFGPAATPVREFFAIAEAQWMAQGGTGWWLRHWKDPWQAGLLPSSLLDTMADKLRAASAAVEPVSVHDLRLAELREAFALTGAFIRYHEAIWQLHQLLNEHSLTRAPLDPDKAARLARSALIERNTFTSLAAATRGHPRMNYYNDTSWVLRYDAFAGLLTAAIRSAQQQQPWNDAASTSVVQLMQVLDAVDPTTAAAVREAQPSRPALFDTDFSHFSNPRVWTPQSLPSEGLTIRAEDDGGLFVNNARRASVHQLFHAEPGAVYHAVMDVSTAQSLTGEVYIQLQFYDADQQQIASTPRSRIAPTAAYGELQRLHAVLKAPAETAFGRIFIRFYELDPETPAHLSRVTVEQIMAPTHP
jgi:hypothetical protein